MRDVDLVDLSRHAGVHLAKAHHGLIKSWRTYVALNVTTFIVPCWSANMTYSRSKRQRFRSRTACSNTIYSGFNPSALGFEDYKCTHRALRLDKVAINTNKITFRILAYLVQGRIVWAIVIAGLIWQSGTSICWHVHPNCSVMNC